MAAYYPLFDDDLKQGPPGPPGAGFKLTNEGHYDMEKKNLKNLNEPIDLNDSSTKSYVDRTHDEIKNHVRDLTDTALIHSETDYFNAKNKRISNIKEPNDLNDAVNKLYVDYYCIIWDKQRKVYYAHDETISNVASPRDNDDAVNKNYVDTNCLMQANGIYDLKNLRITNVPPPQHRDDAVNRNYVDKRIKINDKKENNILSRDNDGLYVPSLLKNGMYNFENKRLTNVANPIINKDVATKEYVDSQDFYATIKERYFRYTTNGFKTVEFNLFSSKLIDPNMKLTTNMYMEITIFLTSEMNYKPLIKLQIGNERILQRPLEVNVESVTCFAYGKRNDELKLLILCDGDENDLKPYLHVKKIEFL